MKFNIRPAKTSILIFICFTQLFIQTVQSNSFTTEGSDLLMGVGPADIARGGASTAGSNDIFAIYWNPAGLAQLEKTTFAISRQLDAQLNNLNFIGFSVHKKTTLPISTTLAFAFIPRLHLKTQGSFAENSIEALFIDYALPDYPPDFRGTITSKTYEYRIGVGIKPDRFAHWSIGLTAGLIECGTNSCGIRASDPDNYRVASTDATAFSFGFGSKYHLNDNITIGLSIKDLDTKLHVETITSDNSGTVKNKFITHFPTNISLGFLYKWRNQQKFSLDFQSISGKYGSSALDFKLVRIGYNKSFTVFEINAGFIIPLKLYTATASNLLNDSPSPVLPTFGASWSSKFHSIDFAIYPNPITSYRRKTASISSELSLMISY